MFASFFALLLCLFVCLSACLSVCLFVCLFLLFLCLFVCLFVPLFFYFKHISQNVIDSHAKEVQSQSKKQRFTWHLQVQERVVEHPEIHVQEALGHSRAVFRVGFVWKWVSPQFHKHKRLSSSYPLFCFCVFPGGMTSFWANLWSNQQSMLFKEEVLFVFFVIEATKVHLDISQYIPVARLDRWSRRFPKWWRCSCGFRCSTWVDQWGFAYSLPRKWSFAQHRRIAASGARDCQERAKSGLDRWHRIHRRSWRADCQRTRG